MEWDVESDLAYEEFDYQTDPVEDEDLRLAVLQAIRGWKALGPPEEAEWDERFQVWACDVPGTSAIAEYVVATRTDPPVMIVRRFIWERPLN